MSSPRPDSPNFDFADDGGRPKVVTYITTSKYRTGDKVYLLVGTTFEGPYLIATVPSAGKYTLCLENGQSAKNGGCVRDVREISKYVNNSLVNVHTQLFTADSSAIASETSELLATYSNVKFGFQKILSAAEPGNYVYIHYSGHGVRMEASSEFSSRTTGDLALNVIEDSSQNVTRPFPGLELAYILKDMVTKGLIVTLVLDCCFSGSVLRYDSASDYSSIRYREYGSSGLWTKDIEESGDRGSRDASMLRNWLVNPEGYTVIAACGPHEVALELNFGGETSDYRHGALSYFLLRAMKKLGGLGGKHAHIYPYLCSMFRQSRPTQNPMWYGNKDLYFFGDATLSTELTGAPFAVIWSGSCLQLQGGQAHGICEGDQFAPWPFVSRGLALIMSPSRVLDIVERLAKFQLIRDLTNKSQDAPFGGLYRVTLIDQAGEAFQTGSIVNVNEGDTLKLVVENQGEVDLYVHIYNLGPLGQVKNILKASYVVIAQRKIDHGFTGEWTQKLRTKVPRVLLLRGIASCEDTIKIFITSQPTSFASLEMQNLDDSHDHGVIEPGPIRGGGPSVEREDWVALDFRICTRENVYWRLVS
ncbi:hypothetical protein HD806DRAFT_521143 [Xylariaceae sp. AK1471]|nr:hypothetical protein HD806DRAFT_521143 [Xylariaceae sp. AK1471]